jgi:hypothetical protein
VLLLANFTQSIVLGNIEQIASFNAAKSPSDDSTEQQTSTHQEAVQKELLNYGHLTFAA